MQLNLDLKSDIPIYQQITDSIAQNIQAGTLEAGYKLPTVRDLAEEYSISKGTAKHAYDTLEQMGFIEKTQGRGTFVSGIYQNHSSSKKEQALAAIDKLLDEMEALSFSLKDTRIILDLKLRERAQLYRSVRVGAVDCSPEALSMISSQISALPHVDISEFLLQTVLDDPKPFAPNLDMIITTHTHFKELSGKLTNKEKLMQMVLSVSSDTVSHLARIPAGASIGILCVSKRFSEIMSVACERFCVGSEAPEVMFLGNPGQVKKFIESKDKILLPDNYPRFCSQSEMELISSMKEAPILYQYQIDKGSLLHLEEEMERIYQENLENS